MKKTIIRILSLVLTVSALLGVLSTSASAMNDPDTVCTDARKVCVPVAQAADVYTAAEWNRLGRVFGYEKVTYVKAFKLNLRGTSLTKLAAYMPHIPQDAVPAKGDNVTFDIPESHQFMAYSVAQDALDKIAIVKKDPAGSLAVSECEYQHYLSVSANSQLYVGVKGAAPTASVLQEGNKAGTVKFVLVPGASMWKSDSLQNDKTLRHVIMSERTFYYGENVFRNSALETVVFPWNLFSDHVAPNDIDPALRVVSGLATGKEAIVIAKDAFSDCAKLTSVIFPTEPARLYLEDGVFANCPKLTVYAPAGGYLESYCKANGIKFQAIANGYLEPKVDAVPTEWCANHSNKDAGIAARCPISTYEPGFPDARILVTVRTVPNTVYGHEYYDEIAAKQLASVAHDRDMNRYRGAEAARFTKDNVLKVIWN